MFSVNARDSTNENDIIDFKINTNKYLLNDYSLESSKNIHHSLISKANEIKNKDTNNFDKKTDINNEDNQNKNKISFLFTSEKAGMHGLNRDEINKITLECTKNSVITKKKQEEYDLAVKVVEDWKMKLESLNKNSFIYEQIRKLAEMKMREIEKTRDLTKIWMHLDMDMFYAAIEIRDNPTLKDLPVAVGDERMISTSNYVARKFGVRSAMPGFIAKRLCPDLKFISINFEKVKVNKKINY